MKRFAPLFWLALILLAGGSLMKISYEVDAKEHELHRLKAQWMANEDSIRVLRAEWAYLNQPQRLEKLSAKYLALGPMQVAQLQTDLPSAQTASAAPTTVPANGIIRVAVTSPIGHASRE